MVTTAARARTGRAAGDVTGSMATARIVQQVVVPAIVGPQGMTGVPRCVVATRPEVGRTGRRTVDEMAPETEAAATGPVMIARSNAVAAGVMRLVRTDAVAPRDRIVRTRAMTGDETIARESAVTSPIAAVAGERAMTGRVAVTASAQVADKTVRIVVIARTGVTRTAGWMAPVGPIAHRAVGTNVAAASHGRIGRRTDLNARSALPGFPSRRSPRTSQ